MSNENKKIEIKIPQKAKKYIIAEIIIAIFMVLLLIAARIFNFDDNIILKVLEGFTLLSIVILNVMVINTSK